jgi:uncharacterized protein (DUF983 family)
MASEPVPVIEFGGSQASDRSLGRSIWRGLKCKCAKCGTGRLFYKFIKPVDRCDRCNEDFRPERADDLPAYLVIMVIGHITVGGYLGTELLFTLASWQHLAIWVPVSVLGALALLQPVKGGVIGLQWALRMHGFGGHEDQPEDVLPLSEKS